MGLSRRDGPPLARGVATCLYCPTCAHRCNSHYLRKKLPAGEFLAWVAEAEGEIVATSGLVFFERPPNGTSPAGLEAYVMSMYTLPRWRGRGLATALLDAAIAHVKGTDARRVWLHATDAGRPVYERAGFRASDSEMELTW